MDAPLELYLVVKNVYNQYSIWPCNKNLPDGWEMVAHQADSKKNSLDFILREWTCLRPVSHIIH